jgi:hypothetical protein
VVGVCLRVHTVPVAGGIDAGPGRAHAVIDDDAALWRDGDPMLGEPEAFDVGRAAGGDQYFVGVDRRLFTIACDREGTVVPIAR